MLCINLNLSIHIFIINIHLKFILHALSIFEFINLLIQYTIQKFLFKNSYIIINFMLYINVNNCPINRKF